MKFWGKKVQCLFCEEEFREGTGHSCWCPECKRPEPMCNKCYKEFKKSGAIEDKQVNICDFDNKDRYT